MRRAAVLLVLLLGFSFAVDARQSGVTATDPCSSPASDSSDQYVDGDPSYEEKLFANDDFREVEAALSEDYPEQIAQAFGARDGGRWIDRTGPKSVLRVGVQNATSEDQAILDSITNSNPRVAVRPVKYSDANLLSYHAQIAGILHSHGIDYGVGLDDEVNKVMVWADVEDDPQVVIQIAVSVPSDAYQIFPGGGFCLL